MNYLHETWPLSIEDLHRLQRNDRAMIRLMCHVKPEEVTMVRSKDLLEEVGLKDLGPVLTERRLRWYGHVERATCTSGINCARDFTV